MDSFEVKGNLGELNAEESTSVVEGDIPKVTRKRAQKRATRKPVGLRKVDNAPTRKGYYRRWVNDKGKRIDRFEEGWYEKVIGDNGQPMTRLGGGNLTQYLMELPIELYEQDQAKKHEDSAAVIGDMLEAKNGQYIPNKSRD